MAAAGAFGRSTDLWSTRWRHLTRAGPYLATGMVALDVLCGRAGIKPEQLLCESWANAPARTPPESKAAILASVRSYHCFQHDH